MPFPKVLSPDSEKPSMLLRNSWGGPTSPKRDYDVCKENNCCILTVDSSTAVHETKSQGSSPLTSVSDSTSGSFSPVSGQSIRYDIYIHIFIIIYC